MTRTHRTDLAAQLCEAIARGEFPVGALLPTELELCAQYDLSRYSVRKALDELQEMGLISRRKNVGTRVEAVRPASTFAQSLATIDELANFGAAYERQVQQMQDIVLTTSLAKQIGCEPGSQWFQVSSLRVARGTNSKPICWTDVYVEPCYAQLKRKFIHSPNTLLSEIIHAHDGRTISTIHQDIEAVILSGQLASSLSVEAGTAALRITRRYSDMAGKVFEVSQSVHPCARFKLSTQMVRMPERV